MCRNIKTLFNFEPPVTDSESGQHRCSSSEKLPASTGLRESMTKRSLPLLMRCPESRAHCYLRWKRRQPRRIGNKRRLKQGRMPSEDSALNSRVKIAASEHPSRKRMLVCNSGV